MSGETTSETTTSRSSVSRYSFNELALLKSGVVLEDAYENGVRYIIMRGPGSLCAYVGVPTDHPLAGYDYDSIPLNVHGGLTFSARGRGESLPSAWYWYGWDYNHLHDKSFYSLELPDLSFADDHGWTVEEVRGEMWDATYEFAKLCSLAARIARRSTP